MVWPSEDFGKIEMALDVKKIPHPCSKEWEARLITPETVALSTKGRQFTECKTHI